MARFSSSRSESGFSLVEVIVATGILAVSLISLAQLFAVATQANSAARAGTFSAVLAQQKVEQLRGLTWGFDTLGLPLSDTTTNTTVYPETSTAGTGLSPSPTSTLASNTNGYVDYLDAAGNLLGGGATMPSGTVYIRRWSVEPLPTNPNNTLILQVLVTRIKNRQTATGDTAVRRMPDEARVIAVKTRKYT